MPQTRSNSATKMRPQTTSVQPQASTFPPTSQKMMYKSSTIVSTIPEKMTSKTPVEIGTRGTVGSLIMQEIDYFSQLSSQKPQCQCPDMASSRSYSRPKHGSLITTPKKKRGSSRLIPSMCSMVEVAENNQPKAISGLSYRSLKADVKRLHV